MADRAKFLADIASDNADVRFAAWRSAGELEADVIGELAKLAVSDRPGVGKAAREAIHTLVHSVGKDAGAARRGEVAKALVAVAASSAAAMPARVLALRDLSVIAAESDVAAIGKLIHDPDLREEAVFSIERIPGSAPDKTLAAAYRESKDDFKPRLLAALGHRRAQEGVALAVDAMRSSNKEIAVAGARAYGRIGRKPAGAVRVPDASGLEEWLKIDVIDSQLRFADEQVKQGNHTEAMRIYKTALDRPEEHWQCAAIVGIAKMGSPEAAVAIFPKLKSGNRKVRITAANAWKQMAHAGA
ncbi:MAG: hypothetical protein ACRD8O_03840 [Bryobacteraceae bacterium]